MKLQTGLLTVLFAFGSVALFAGCQQDASATAKQKPDSTASTKQVAPKRSSKAPSGASNSVSQLQPPIGVKPGPVAVPGPTLGDPALMADPAMQLQASQPGPGDNNGPGSGPQGMAP